MSHQLADLASNPVEVVLFMITIGTAYLAIIIVTVVAKSPKVVYASPTALYRWVDAVRA